MTHSKALFDISEFADISHTPPTTEELSEQAFGHYRAYQKGTDDAIGYIQYRTYQKDSLLVITGSYTDPAWRNRDVAATLIDRLVHDHPRFLVDVGRDDPNDLPGGSGFYESLKVRMPYFMDTVVQEVRKRTKD